MKQNLHICGQSCDRFDLMKYIQEDSALVSDELFFVTGRANISSFVSVSGKSVLCNYGQGGRGNDIRSQKGSSGKTITLAWGVLNF